jgi:hypothetical protein
MTTPRHFPDMPAAPPPRRQLQGLDYQGRHPEAAHAATDMGVDRDDLACAAGIVRAVIWALLLWLAGTLTTLALLWGAP